MTTWIALCYSPVELKASLEDFKANVIDHSSIKQYLIVEEYPDLGKAGDPITHFHAVLETTQSRANIRKRLLKNINKHFYDKRDEEKYMLDTEEHNIAKTPIEVPLGYILKQHPKMLTNMDMTPERVELCIAKHEQAKKDKLLRPSLKDSLSLNEFINNVLLAHIHAEVNVFDNEVYQTVFSANKKFMPYSVFSKINKQTLTTYVNMYLYDQQF